MSSTPHYKSHLFKTAQSRFHQWQHKIQLRWRQLKTVTVWGAQLGLHPFYVIFQAGRWGSRILQHSAAHGAKRLSAALGLEPVVATDQPVQNVLAAIHLQQIPAPPQLTEASHPAQNNPPQWEWQISIQPPTRSQRTWRDNLTKVLRTVSTTIKVSTPLQLAPAPNLSPSPIQHPQQNAIIQGIASSLAEQRLVLVTPQNQILDILSAEQHLKLQQRIIWEMVDAARSQPRRPQALPSWTTYNTLPILARPQMSLPVKGLHTLMAWVQQQSLAPQALYPEPSQIQPPAGTFLLPIAQRLSLNHTWTPFKQAWLSWLKSITHPVPTNALPPAHPPQGLATSTTPILVFQSLVDHLRIQIQTLRVRQTSSALVAPQTSTVNRQRILQPLFKQVQQWIKQHPVLATGVSAIALLPFTLALPEPAQAATAPAIPMPRSLPIEWRIDPSQFRKRSKEETDIEGLTSQASQGKVRVPFQKSPKPLPAQPSLENAIADWANRFAQTTVSNGNPAIEIDAEFIGYDWHPLQQILLSLDKGIAWIETQITHWWPILRNRSHQLWQHWWPVIQNQTRQLWNHWQPIVQTQLTKAWAYAAPKIKKGLQVVLEKTIAGSKQQGQKLWQMGRSRLQTWMKGS